MQKYLNKKWFVFSLLSETKFKYRFLSFYIGYTDVLCNFAYKNFYNSSDAKTMQDIDKNFILNNIYYQILPCSL